MKSSQAEGLFFLNDTCMSGLVFDKSDHMSLKFGLKCIEEGSKFTSSRLMPLSWSILSPFSHISG